MALGFSVAWTVAAGVVVTSGALGDGVPVGVAVAVAGEAVRRGVGWLGAAAAEERVVGNSWRAAAAGEVAVRTTVTVAGATSVRIGSAGMTALVGWARSEPLAAIATTPSTTSRPPTRPLSVIRFIGLGDYPLAKVLFLEWHQISSRELLYQGKELP